MRVIDEVRDRKPKSETMWPQGPRFKLKVPFLMENGASRESICENASDSLFFLRWSPFLILANILFLVSFAPLRFKRFRGQQPQVCGCGKGTERCAKPDVDVGHGATEAAGSISRLGS